MQSFLQDVRYALRSLVQQPLLSLSIVGTLTLGIGASTAIFSAVSGVLLTPLPYERPDELVEVVMARRAPGGAVSGRITVSTPDFMDISERVGASATLVAAQSTALVLLGDQQPERVSTANISPGLLEMFGLSLAHGRAFNSEEAVSSAAPAAILTDSIWRSRWNADPAVVGSTVATTDGSIEVVGVLAPEARLPEAMRLEGTDVLLPLPLDAEAYTGNRTSYTLHVAARVAAASSLDALRQQLRDVGSQLAEQFPSAKVRSTHEYTFDANPLFEVLVGSRRADILLCFGASALLLLIGCVNVANLLVARASGRSGELALRNALGASRLRVVRQLLTESMVAALAGGIGGAVLAFGLVAAFRTVGPGDFPRLAAVQVDGIALVLALSTALVTGVVFGVVPALLGARSEAVDSLRDLSGKSSAGRRRVQLRNVLVVSEVALAMILLAGAGLLVSSYLRLQRVDPGIEPEGLLMTEIGLGESYDSDEARSTFFSHLAAEINAIPGVRSVSAIADPPLGYSMWTPGVRLTGPDEASPPVIAAHLVLPDYFKTTGMHLVSGRSFTRDDDTAETPLVAIVNEQMVADLWPGSDPLGERFTISPDPDDDWFTVIGVVSNVHQMGLADSAEPTFYVAYAQQAWFPWMNMVVRVDPAVRSLAPQLREALRTVDPRIPFDGVIEFSERLAASLTAERFRTLLLGAFATVAIILAASGIYGTTLYSLSKRQHEVGIRLAVGASPASVVGLLVRQGIGVSLAGIALGLAGALSLTRLLASFLYEVMPSDPVTLASSALALLMVALAAYYVPARRAARIDPLIALSAE